MKAPTYTKDGKGQAVLGKGNPGKGDAPRPVNKRAYDNNFDAIRWKSRPPAK